MFDDLIKNDKESPIDALLKLLDKNDPEVKSILEMANIRYLLINERLWYRKNTDKNSLDIDKEINLKYLLLKMSLKGKSREQTVEGIKEMKPALLEGNIQEGLIKKK